MLRYDLDVLLFDKRRFWKVNTAIERTGLSRKNLIKAVVELNETLSSQKKQLIEFKNDTLIIPENFVDFEKLRFEIKNPKLISIKENERECLIYLLSFSEQEELSIFAFQELLNVSRNTVLSDVKKLRMKLKTFGIKLEYSRKVGFFLVGNEEKIRSIAFGALQQLQEQTGNFVLSNFLNKRDPLQLYKTEQDLKSIINQLEIKIVTGRYLSLIFFICLISLRQKKGRLIENNSNLIDTSQDVIFTKNESEKNYLIALLIGASDGNFQNRKLDFLYRVSFQIMENVMKLAAVEFDDFTKTFEVLLAHLIPAYFRLKNHFPLENALLARIKQEYLELFELVAQALEPLEKVCGKIPDSELAYFVILFGGEIYKKDRKKGLRAIVLCANGVSSSLIMKKRLEYLFPSMDFILATSISQLDEIPVNCYDIIFSTLNVKVEKKVYLMSPLPSEEEERILYNQVITDFALPSLPFPSTESIFMLIRPYLKENVNEKQIKTMISQRISRQKMEKENNEPMLSDLLTQDNIQFTNKHLSWEEAIALAAKPLIDNASIETTYIDAMVNRIKEFGPFVDLGMGIALPHARPEEGVNKVGMAFLKCENSVFLLDDPKHEIKVFVVLAAVDNESHLKALSTLTKILSNKTELEKLLTASTATEVEKVLLQEEEK